VVRWLFTSVAGCEEGEEGVEVVVVDRSTEMRHGIVHRTSSGWARSVGAHSDPGGVLGVEDVERVGRREIV
jgi:hypothetical protein